MSSNNFREKDDFISYKKLLVFGAESSGKSSFAHRLTKGKFKEDLVHTQEGKIIIIINLYYSCSRKPNRIQIKRWKISKYKSIRNKNRRKYNI